MSLSNLSQKQFASGLIIALRAVGCDFIQTKYGNQQKRYNEVALAVQANSIRMGGQHLRFPTTLGYYAEWDKALINADTLLAYSSEESGMNFRLPVDRAREYMTNNFPISKDVLMELAEIYLEPIPGVMDERRVGFHSRMSAAA